MPLNAGNNGATQNAFEDKKNISSTGIWQGKRQVQFLRTTFLRGSLKYLLRSNKALLGKVPALIVDKVLHISFLSICCSCVSLTFK